MLFINLTQAEVNMETSVETLSDVIVNGRWSMDDFTPVRVRKLLTKVADVCQQ